jgi:hypothetical protein
LGVGMACAGSPLFNHVIMYSSIMYSNGPHSARFIAIFTLKLYQRLPMNLFMILSTA